MRIMIRRDLLLRINQLVGRGRPSSRIGHPVVETAHSQGHRVADGAAGRDRIGIRLVELIVRDVRNAGFME